MIHSDKRACSDLRVAFRAEIGGRPFIAYALCRADAIRDLAALAGAPPGIIDARRAPEADSWIFDPAGAASRVLREGFPVTCSGCGACVTSDGVCLFKAGLAYCSARCAGEGLEDHSQELEDAARYWPKASVLGAKSSGGRLAVHMLFDEGRHAFWYPDLGEICVAPVDQQAWAEFDAQMRSGEA